MTALDDWIDSFEADLSDAVSKVVAKYQAEIGAITPDAIRLEIVEVAPRRWPRRYCVGSIMVTSLGSTRTRLTR